VIDLYKVGMNTLEQDRTSMKADSLDESAAGNNNEPLEEREVVTVESSGQFRELQVETARPPLRMRLTPPIEYDGEKFSEMIFDFDAMTAKDFERAEREFTHMYKPERNEITLPEMKHLYHEIIAAHRADVPLGVIRKLPRRFYVPLRTEVLKACGSSPEEEKA
jgi:hypothetical protein